MDAASQWFCFWHDLWIHNSDMKVFKVLLAPPSQRINQFAYLETKTLAPVLNLSAYQDNKDILDPFSSEALCYKPLALDELKELLLSKKLRSKSGKPGCFGMIVSWNEGCLSYRLAFNSNRLRDGLVQSSAHS